MHILKLPWLGHKAENKQVDCYSVSVNHDGSRLASGGLDGNVKIWDTATILAFTKLSKEPMKNSKSDWVDVLQQGDLPPPNLRRPLCSMSRHNGVVTSVKFSPDGRFLASGSDDKICLIWEKDEEQANRPKQFGVEEADLEHWTVRKRLVAHDNDIQDIGWSPDGSLLVTVGLDRSIIIWNGLTFERIKRYDIHQSMVKGIVFDPANKFFATASDDRTVRIFRYYKKLNDLNNYEFQMEHIVMDPFKKSPLTSYFRRMSWSPDGQHIAVPNATNGPVPSVAIISRGNWATDISLIGHEAPCEVCAFSPRLFDNGTSKDKDHQFSTVLATAGQDRTLVVWSTATSRPLVIAEDIVENSITDMCWSPEGNTIYFGCLDGSITCINFEENELGKVVSEETIHEQLHRYGADRESAIFPESVEQLELEDIAEKKQLNQNENKPQLIKTKETTPQAVAIVKKPKEAEPLVPQALSPAASSKLKALSQNITITKSGKKRVAPLLVSTTSNNTRQTFTSTSSSQSKLTSKKLQNSNISQPSYYLPRLGVQTVVHGLKHKTTDDQIPTTNGLDDQDNDNEDMGFDDTSNNQNISEAALKRQRNKSKKLLMEARYPNSFKYISNLPSAMFNCQQILNHEVNSILNNLTNQPQEIQTDITSNTYIDVDEDLTFAVILASVEHVKDGSHVRTTMEVRNGQPWNQYEEEYDHNDKIDFNDPTRFIVTNSQDKVDKKYTLYFPYKIQHILPLVDNDTLRFVVLISFAGTIQFLLAESGNYVCPSIELGESIVSWRYGNGFLMLLTSSGLIYTWKLSAHQQHIKSILKKVSIAAVLNSIEVPISGDSKQVPALMLANVKYFELDCRDGSPLVILDGSNDLYQYSRDLQTWIKVLDSWYYLSLEDDYQVFNKTIGGLFTTTFHDFKQDIKRAKLNKYIFSTNESLELQTVMKSRFQELVNEES